MKKWWLFIGMLFFVVHVQASTIREEALTCPIGCEPITATMAGSGTSFGTQLDFKPIGPIVAPWPLAKCPSNGFVIFKDDFSDAELEKLTQYVASEEYQTLQKQHSNYYLAAQLTKWLGEDDGEFSALLLQATWEVEDDNERYTRYATETIAAYEAAAQKIKSDERAWELIVGELERRTGQFVQAEKRFVSLSKHPFKQKWQNNVVAYQLKLIKARDQQPHEIPVE